MTTTDTCVRMLLGLKRLMQTFESLLGVEVHLLSLRYLFENFLDDNPVIDPNITVSTP